MNANFVRRMPMWRTLVWAGVVGSVLSWAWAWYVVRGSVAVMLFVAIASVLLAYKGTTGMRWALVGLMVAGLTMFLAALYWLYMLAFVARGQVGATDWLAVSFFPMVFAVVLLVGAVPGFRHTRDASQPPAEAKPAQ
jgi:hypothetical protein